MKPKMVFRPESQPKKKNLKSRVSAFFSKHIKAHAHGDIAKRILHMKIKKSVVDRLQKKEGGGGYKDFYIHNVLHQYHMNTKDRYSTEEKIIAIVVGLGACKIPTEFEDWDDFFTDLDTLQDILKAESEDPIMMHAIVMAFFNELFFCRKALSPCMSIVLNLFDGEMIPEIVKWVFDSRHDKENLRHAMSNLLEWVITWRFTPNLRHLVISFMESICGEYMDVVNKVSLEKINSLFEQFMYEDTRRFVAQIVIFMLGILDNGLAVYKEVLPLFCKMPKILEKEKESPENIFYIRRLIWICCKAREQCPEFERIQTQLESIIDIGYYSPISSDSEDPREQGLQVGLFNLGNTCYMNSALQALYMTRMFRNEMLQCEFDEPSMFCSIQNLLLALHYSGRVAISPYGVWGYADEAGFEKGIQHDSSEFLLSLLDLLHEQEEQDQMEKGNFRAPQNSNTLSDTIVQRTFGGKTTTAYICSQCGRRSEKVDNFRELPLCFPEDEEENEKNLYSVSSLLTLYVQPEKLVGDNKYRCDKCGLVEGQKETKIIEEPKRLIMTIKRFKYDVKTYAKIKLFHEVTLEENIQVNGVVFELYALVVHRGYSTDRGHYFSMAKEEEDWIIFNDDAVSRVSGELSHHLTYPDTPYILFYRSSKCAEPDDININSLSCRMRKIRDEKMSEKDKS